MNQEHTNFLVASVEALKSEVARKDLELSQRNQLIGIYEQRLQINQPKQEVKPPLHKRYPAAFQPFSSLNLS